METVNNGGLKKSKLRKMQVLTFTPPCVEERTLTVDPPPSLSAKGRERKTFELNPP